MPIPVITDHFLAQVVLPAFAPSTNRFINTWFFRNDQIARPASGMADAIRDVLDDFYDANIGTTPSRLSNFLSNVIQRTGVEYRVYDLGQPSPRVPLIREPAPDWQAAGGGATPLPNECSAVLSYRSGPTGGQGGTTNRRARGRVYIGPLTDTSRNPYVTQEPDAQLSTTLRQRLVDGALGILNNVVDVQWMQYSRVANVMSTVSGGFVDARFDTQRRRGEEVGLRTVFTA